MKQKKFTVYAFTSVWVDNEPDIAYRVIHEKLGEDPIWKKYKELHTRNYKKTEEGKQQYYKNITKFEEDHPDWMTENQRPSSGVTTLDHLTRTQLKFKKSKDL